MSGAPTSPDTRAVLKEALRAVKDMQGQLEAAERVRSEPIAIVGMGCRFPGGADSPEAFWTLLAEGVDAIREVPATRWTPEEYAALDPEGARSRPRQYGGFLDGIEQFDPHFFGIAPREAVAMDPQHRLVLEVCWAALEDAGHAPDRLRGSLTGVFVGITSNDYATHLRQTGSRLDVYSANGTVHNSAAGRISYLLGLHGPSIAVDTACSASLTAIHLACQSLRLGESDLALAGGVNSLIVPDGFVPFTAGGMFAADGRCKTFDAAADGLVRAEGCGVVVLKRLSDAVSSGDRVLALIRGSAVNQDGPSSGLTVPNGPAQEAVLRRALSVARVKPAEVSYVEAHGTGTPLGDPIELGALDAVLSEGRAADSRLVVGAVKTNVGHLEAASGVAGVMKVVLSLRHGVIPANLHFTRLNPAITLRRLAVTLPTSPVPWAPGGSKRIAGVSSFGLSGTNAHVVIEEAPPRPAGAADAGRGPHLVAVSAKSAAALRTLAGTWRERLERDRTATLADVERTSTYGRSHFAHRAAMVVASPAELTEALGAVETGRTHSGLRVAPSAVAERPPVVFLFTGQGSQYAGMGRELYRSQPVFREALDRCQALLGSRLGRPLLEVMHEASPNDGLLDQTAWTQPALFALEYALGQMWRSWGVEPDAVMGHSIGEYVAACVAGVFGLEEAIELVAARGRLMQALPAGGAMAAVLGDEARVRAAMNGLGDRVSIAAANGPSNVVIAGTQGAVDAVTLALQAEGIASRPLTVSHAFHSALMDPMLPAFEEVARGVSYAAPRLALVSNVTGRVVAPDEVPDAAYWCRHVRETVRFADGMRALYDLGHRVFLECGPAPTLIGMGRRAVPGGEGWWLSSLRRERGDWQELLASLASLYVLGLDPDWKAALDGPGRPMSLPTYPFERERHWPDAPRRVDTGASGSRRHGEVHPLLGAPVRAAVRQTLFEREISASSPAFLGDHVVNGEVVFPAAGYVELALSAGAQETGEPCAVEDLAIAEPLRLPRDGVVALQTVLTRHEDGLVDVEVLSSAEPASGSTPHWVSHATARLRVGAAPPAASPSLAEARRRCVREAAVADLYQAHRERGLEYGPAFQGLAGIWTGEAEALGRIARTEAIAADESRYVLHPAVLDSALQTLGVAIGHREDAAGAYLPVGVERVRVAPGGPAEWSHVRVHVGDDPAHHGFTADLTLFDDSGAVVAEIAGLRLRRATGDALRRAARAGTDGWLYDIEWRHDAEPVGPARAEGHWILLAGADAAGARLARAIEQDGGRVTMLPGQLGVADLEQLCRRASSGSEPLRGFIHLRALDSAPSSGPLAADLLRSTGTLLHLAQAMLRAGISAPIWVVTRGAQPVGPAGVVNPVQAPAWALARTIAAEHPLMTCACIDLDPADSAGDVAALWLAIAGGGGEPQIALRDGRAFVARLVPSAVRGRPSAERAVALEIPTRGVLDNLTLQPAGRTVPLAGEVEIRVTHAGLNFRDVLNALGMYPGDPGPLGAECVGRVAAVGPGVQHLKVGDEVLAMAGGSMRSYVTALADRVAVRPPSIAPELAASIPIAFLTVEYGLCRLARIQRGDRVLVHAAAGGVGLAAVQIAQRAGAEIFGTAGSPEKRALLAELGVQHVLDSRSLDFSREILAITGGRGVDVVLNSLAGDFIEHSVAALAPNGRFVEIGKSGIWTVDEMAARRPDVAYFPVYLGDVEPPIIQDMLQGLLRDFVAGILRPLPCRVYPAGDASSAFRFMAQAKHVGKIVLAFTETTGAAQVRADATYLVTGGCGGLGLAAAGWLADRGARHVALVGRGGARSADAAAGIDRLRASGVEVRELRADVGSRADVERLVDALSDWPELKGVIHAAGIVEDGTVERAEWPSFERLFGAKVHGSWHLHEATKARALDFFVLFSSAASVIATPGQGNYAAANAYLDALAHHRRAAGLPATSVNWGPWADRGMASALQAQGVERWRRFGFGSIRADQGVALLEQVLDSGAAQVAVLPVDWRRLGEQSPGGTAPPLVADLILAAPRVHGASAPARPVLVDRVERAPARTRMAIIQQHVRDVVRQVLGVDPSFTLELTQGLRAMGMDSLMAIELRNHLQASVGRALPSTLAFDCPTVGALAAHLGRLFSIDEGFRAAGRASEETAPVDDGDLRDLSDVEAEALLAQELEK